ncbi:hypothetical protein MCUN1_002621 [Malassezia cuniculi]|uniref:Carboxylic ester hydrolase n=1 Tax=Malassezia cuniculi TaxID=948313 RepID=A0AAF0J7K6_9BASI|nr:hypothetical protein MCUN1_002621 [Malassezia cuniculi]
MPLIRQIRGNKHNSTSRAASGSGSDRYVVVNTDVGTVRGGYNDTTGAYHWLGVPFGQSTEGQNRFMPPKERGRWNGVHDGTKFGMSCPQHNVGSAEFAIRMFGVSEEMFDLDVQSEDCLNLDIFAGKQFWEKFVRASDEEKRNMRVPVWFNIYGGSFEWGSSRVTFYRGDYIVTEDDILVVNINFRNWIFGFPNAPHLSRDNWSGSGEYPGANPGWLDIELAIQWVRKHIEYFGGDPNKITIGGTSSGAALADNWSYVHYGKDDADHVNAAILQSGSMTSLGRYFTTNSSVNLAAHYSSWNNVSATVGCGRDTNAAQFNCMQQKHWQELMNATLHEHTSQAQFGPLADGVTFFDDYFDRLQNGHFARIPYLIGNTKDEGNTVFTKHPELAPLFGPFVTAEIWVCPTSVQSRIRSNMNIPTFRYRFSPSFFLPQTPWPQRALGTSHGTDTAYAWGTWQDLMWILDTNYDDSKLAIPTSDFRTRAAVSDLYRETMVQFVIDPEHGLERFHYGHWPEYREHAKTIGDIGYNNEGKLYIISSDDVDGLCPLTDVETEAVYHRFKDSFNEVLRPFIA